MVLVLIPLRCYHHEGIEDSTTTHSFKERKLNDFSSVGYITILLHQMYPCKYVSFDRPVYYRCLKFEPVVGFASAMNKKRI